MLTTDEPYLIGHEPADAFARVASYLTEHGLVPPALLARATEAAATGEPVHHALVRLGLIGEAELARSLATCLGLPLARTADYPALPVEHPALPPRFLEAHRLLPLALDEHRLTLAMADPLDGFAVRALAMATGRQAEVRVAVPAACASVALDGALADLREWARNKGIDHVDEKDPSDFTTCPFD